MFVCFIGIFIHLNVDLSTASNAEETKHRQKWACDNESSTCSNLLSAIAIILDLEGVFVCLAN